MLTDVPNPAIARPTLWLWHWR